MNISFSLYKSAPKNCKHENINIRSYSRIHHRPSRGVCEDCGKWVKAKITWEEIKL